MAAISEVQNIRSNWKLFTESKIHSKILAYSYTKRILYSSEMELDVAVWVKMDESQKYNIYLKNKS